MPRSLGGCIISWDKELRHDTSRNGIEESITKLAASSSSFFIVTQQAHTSTCTYSVRRNLLTSFNFPFTRINEYSVRSF